MSARSVGVVCLLAAVMVISVVVPVALFSAAAPAHVEASPGAPAGARSAAPDLALVPAAGSYAFIYPNCSTSATPPFAEDATTLTFTLTGDYAGSIVDECSGSTLNGSGYEVTSTNDFAVQVNTTTGVTVTDLLASDTAGNAIEVVNSTGALVEDDQVASGSTTGIYAVSDTGVTIRDVGANGTELGADLALVEGGSLESSWFNGATDEAVILIASTDLSVDHVTALDAATALEIAGVSGASISNSNLSGADDGVYGYLSSDVTLDNVTAIDSGDGIGLQQVNDSSVTDSNFSNAVDIAMEAYLDTDLTVAGTNLSDAGDDGALVVETTDATFQQVVANESGFYGLDFENSTSVSVQDSWASFNGWDGLRAISTSGLSSTHDVFDNETAVDGNGTFLNRAFNVTLTDDQDDGAVVGVIDIGSSGVRETDLNATNDYDGYIFENDASVSVAGSTAYRVYDGLILVASSNDAIDGVTVVNATEYGFVLEFAQETLLQDSSVRLATGGLADLESYATNLVNDSFTNVEVGLDADTVLNSTVNELFVHNATEYGFGLFDCFGVTVENGNVSASATGFELDTDGQDLIIGNTFFADALDFDIDAPGILGPVGVYWNNFIAGGGWSIDVGDAGNSTLAFADGYPGGGNYWSNWTSPDLMHGPGQNLPGGDGIVDDPLQLQGPFSDPYPLTAKTSIAQLSVEFLALGLPSGTAWSVTFGTATESSSSPSLTFNSRSAATGVTIGYTVQAPAGWRALTPAGSITTNGQAHLVLVDFHPVTFNQTFRETGLVHGTIWGVTINGTPYTSTGTSITVPLANGTYNFTVDAVAGYVLVPTNGSLLVDASQGTTTVTFTAVAYSVTFSQSGLPSGTSWGVTFDGFQKNSTTSTITFDSVNGSYTFATANVSGYSTSGGSGTVLVAGGATSVAVVFTSSSTNNPLTGPNSGWFWGLIALVVILAAALVAVLLLGRRKPPARPAPTEIPPAAAAGAGAAVAAGAAAPVPVPEGEGRAPDWKE